MTTEVLRAGYLPPAWVAAQPQPVDWQTLHFSAWGRSVAVQVPALTPDQLGSLALHVRQSAAATLQRTPVAEIVQALDRVVARWLDPQDRTRAGLNQALSVISGFDAEMVRMGLTDYLKTFRAPELWRFVAGDFSNPAVLDGFQPRPGGGWSRACGPRLMAHVWAGNVPGLPLWSLVSSLLVKAGSVGKVSSSEPLLAGAFAQCLAEVEPRWADALAVVWWRGGDVAQERALFQHADVVLAYGGNAALQALQAQVPVTARYLPHGHKLSLGLVSNSALDVRLASTVARQAAADVARWDQQGCYSPQLLAVQRGGRVSPLEWAQRLSAELDALQHRFPRRELALDEAAGVAAWRQVQDLAALRSSEARVLGAAESPFAVSYVESPTVMQPSALNRTVQVVAFDELDQLLPLLSAQSPYLQTVGMAASPEVLFAWAPALADVGVTRLCALGHMTAPEPGWHHDGRFSLLDLVRMVDIEASAERSAQDFAPYRN